MERLSTLEEVKADDPNLRASAISEIDIQQGCMEDICYDQWPSNVMLLILPEKTEKDKYRLQIYDRTESTVLGNNQITRSELFAMRESFALHKYPVYFSPELDECCQLFYSGEVPGEVSDNQALILYSRMSQFRISETTIDPTTIGLNTLAQLDNDPKVLVTLSGLKSGFLLSESDTSDEQRSTQSVIHIKGDGKSDSEMVGNQQIGQTLESQKNEKSQSSKSSHSKRKESNWRIVKNSVVGSKRSDQNRLTPIINKTQEVKESAIDSTITENKFQKDLSKPQPKNISPNDKCAKQIDCNKSKKQENKNLTPRGKEMNTQSKKENINNINLKSNKRVTESKKYTPHTKHEDVMKEELKIMSQKSLKLKYSEENVPLRTKKQANENPVNNFAQSFNSVASTSRQDCIINNLDLMPVRLKNSNFGKESSISIQINMDNEVASNRTKLIKSKSQANCSNVVKDNNLMRSSGSLVDAFFNEDKSIAYSVAKPKESIQNGNIQSQKEISKIVGKNLTTLDAVKNNREMLPQKCKEINSVDFGSSSKNSHMAWAQSLRLQTDKSQLKVNSQKKSASGHQMGNDSNKKSAKMNSDSLIQERNKMEDKSSKELADKQCRSDSQKEMKQTSPIASEKISNREINKKKVSFDDNEMIHYVENEDVPVPKVASKKNLETESKPTEAPKSNKVPETLELRTEKHNDGKQSKNIKGAETPQPGVGNSKTETKPGDDSKSFPTAIKKKPFTSETKNTFSKRTNKKVIYHTCNSPLFGAPPNFVKKNRLTQNAKSNAVQQKEPMQNRQLEKNVKASKSLNKIITMESKESGPCDKIKNNKKTSLQCVNRPTQNVKAKVDSNAKSKAMQQNEPMQNRQLEKNAKESKALNKTSSMKSKEGRASPQCVKQVRFAIMEELILESSDEEIFHSLPGSVPKIPNDNLGPIMELSSSSTSIVAEHYIDYVNSSMSLLMKDSSEFELMLSSVRRPDRINIPLEVLQFCGVRIESGDETVSSYQSLLDEINYREIPLNRHIEEFFRLANQYSFQIYVRPEIEFPGYRMEPRLRLECFLRNERFIGSVAMLPSQFDSFALMFTKITAERIEDAFQLTNVPTWFVKIMKRFFNTLHLRFVYDIMAELAYEIAQEPASMSLDLP